VPLPVYAKIALWMGGSPAPLHILPALAAAGLVAISILIARELGGGRYAQPTRAINGIVLATELSLTL
jgi:hypothetical protein